MSKNTQKYVVSLGEFMLRLKSPGYERFFQSPMLEATFGGSEANVAITLANLNALARYVTVVPNNQIGKSAERFLKYFGVETHFIYHEGDRLGIYFLEAGSGPRPSVVVYDRANSAIANAKIEEFDWDKIFQDASWFHISGITPALSQSAANLSMEAVKNAKKKGLKVAIDLNYRKNLWKYGKKPPEIMREMVKSADMVVANEEDIQKSLGLEINQKIGGAELEKTLYESLAKKVVEAYPNIEIVAITLRESFSADNNNWSGMCYINSEGKAYSSKKYSLTDIVDRVGGGDAFAGGFLYGITTQMTYKDALEFAVGASALKHTIPGDPNRITLDEVKKLIGGDSSGRVQR